MNLFLWVWDTFVWLVWSVTYIFGDMVYFDAAVSVRKERESALKGFKVALCLLVVYLVEWKFLIGGGVFLFGFYHNHAILTVLWLTSKTISKALTKAAKHYWAKFKNQLGPFSCWLVACFECVFLWLDPYQTYTCNDRWMLGVGLCILRGFAQYELWFEISVCLGIVCLQFIKRLQEKTKETARLEQSLMIQQRYNQKLKKSFARETQMNNELKDTIRYCTTVSKHARIVAEIRDVLQKTSAELDLVRKEYAQFYAKHENPACCLYECNMQKKVAFAMGTQSRLGAKSAVCMVTDTLMLHDIIDQALRPNGPLFDCL